MLLVIREETNVLFTGRDKLGGSKPCDSTVVVNHHFGLILFQTSSKTLGSTVEPEDQENLIQIMLYFTYQLMLPRIFFNHCVCLFSSTCLSFCLLASLCLSVYLALSNLYLGLRPHFGSSGPAFRLGYVTEMFHREGLGRRCTGTRQERDLESRLRQTTHASLYHLTTFSLYFSLTGHYNYRRISRFLPFLSIRIVLSCFFCYFPIFVFGFFNFSFFYSA